MRVGTAMPIRVPGVAGTADVAAIARGVERRERGEGVLQGVDRAEELVPCLCQLEQRAVGSPQPVDGIHAWSHSGDDRVKRTASPPWREFHRYNVYGLDEGLDTIFSRNAGNR